MSLWLGTLSSSGSSIPAIGDSAYGGYMAGIIDTTRTGSIRGDDNYQTGARYLLIASPKSLEVNRAWMTSPVSNAPVVTKTRWNGLEATIGMKNASSQYEAAIYCHDLTFPSDGGSRWYLPAHDELELLYRSFKPTTVNNDTQTYTAASDTWPYGGAVVKMGENISSDPTGVAYTTTNPSRTSLSAFIGGSGAQAFDSEIYWSSTYFNLRGFNSSAWFQFFTSPSQPGLQSGSAMSALNRVRPVRRILL